MQIHVIEPHEVKFAWPIVQRFIEASQRRGPSDMTSAAIRYECMTNECWRLFVIDGGAAAAVVRIWDDRLHVVAIGGKFEKGWYWEFFEWLQRLARFCGLRFVTLGGRKGWSRLLLPLGFKSIGGPYLGVEIT